MSTVTSVIAMGAITLALTISAAQATTEVPKEHFKVIGMASGIPASSYDELPFWREVLPKNSDGNITADITPVDQMGIEASSMLRMLKLGITDFASIDITKMAADDPRFEGCDLAGISTDPKLARAGCEAYKPILEARMENNWNTKLLAIGANTPQVFWCRDEISSLDEFKGKKIRVYNNTLRDFVRGLGATSVNIGFSEVVPALNNGVVDCAVTGSLSGNNAGWGEIAKTVVMLPIGWSVNAVVVNKKRWDTLPEITRAFLGQEFADYEDRLWSSLDKFIAQASNCNTGKESCTLGKKASLKLYYPSVEELERVKDIVANDVLDGWASRCGAECLQAWEETVGPAVGIQTTE